jgi:hypothetical protein
MNEDEAMADYLREIGYPEHVIRMGRSGLIARWQICGGG